ncbi:MAG: site-2 protease family protein, partial [Methylococcaceae bacterium]|nr:site-2 protease family protein [Methylococcaceae bacterium]
QRIAVWVLPVIFAITVHEVAHGWVAKQFGDNTASDLGRLTLNPIKHIDLVGTIILPAMLLVTFTGYIFGWAKPVPVVPQNFKSPRKMMAIVAVAGPVSNILMAIGWALIMRVGTMVFSSSEAIALPLIYSGVAGISINLVLALINLIPIPPLDGGRIVAGLLPEKWAFYFGKLERFGFIILLALLFSGGLNLLLGYPMFIIQQWFFSLGGM